MHMEEKAVTAEMQHQQWELAEVEAGGGYPAAGIGGGGAGGGAGDTAEGGGGFSSGGGEANGARGEMVHQVKRVHTMQEELILKLELEILHQEVL